MNETFLKNPLNLLSHKKSISYSSSDKISEQQKIPKKSFDSYVSEKTQSKDVISEKISNKKEITPVKNTVKYDDKTDDIPENNQNNVTETLSKSVTENQNNNVSSTEQNFIQSLNLIKENNYIEPELKESETDKNILAANEMLVNSQEFMTIPSIALIPFDTSSQEITPLNPEMILESTISLDKSLSENNTIIQSLENSLITENNMLLQAVHSSPETQQIIPLTSEEWTNFSQLIETSESSLSEIYAENLSHDISAIATTPTEHSILDKNFLNLDMLIPQDNNVSLQENVLFPINNSLINQTSQPQISLAIEKIEPHLIGQFPLNNEISVQITKSVDSPNKIGINLEPAGMGEVELVIENNSFDNTVIAVIRSEKPEILESLRKEAASLEKYLAEAGINLSGGSLGFEHKQQQDTGTSSSEQDKELFSARINNQKMSDNNIPAQESASDKAYTTLANLKSLSGIDIRL